jgi:endoglucanase
MTQDESWGRMFCYRGEGHHSTSEPDRNATYGEEDGVDNTVADDQALEAVMDF